MTAVDRYLLATLHCVVCPAALPSLLRGRVGTKVATVAVVVVAVVVVVVDDDVTTFPRPSSSHHCGSASKVVALNNL